MNKDGAVAKDLDAIKNAYNYPDICHFLNTMTWLQIQNKSLKKYINF